MAKREKKQRPAKMTRKYQSRVEQERRQIRYILIGTGVVIAVCVILLFAGLYQTQVANPAATRSAKEALKSVPAATVNDTMISVADWQARVRFERQLRINRIFQLTQQLEMFDATTEFGQQFISQGQAQIEEIQNTLDEAVTLASQALETMIEEQLVRQEAARRGIVVTPEELQNYIEVNIFGFPYPPTPEPIPTLPAPTPPPTVTVTPEPTVAPTASPTPRSRQDFEAEYGQYIEQVKEITEMPEEAWRSLIESELYRQKLQEAFGTVVETSAQQVKGNYISAQDQQTAEELLARLEAGEAFEALVEEIQADESEEPKARAGRFDWSPIEVLETRFGKEFATAALNTDAGDYARTLVPTSDERFYLIYVENNELHELADYIIEQRRQERFQDWLDEEKRGEGIVFGDWQTHVPREPSL